MNQPLHGRNAKEKAKKTAGRAGRRAVLRAAIGAAALCLGLATGYHYKTGVEADSFHLVENGSGQEETNALPGSDEDVIVIGGIDFAQLPQEEIAQVVEKQYPWGMSIVWEGESVLIPNLLAAQVLANLPGAGESCVISLDVLAAAVTESALQAAAAWERPGRPADLAGFDPATGAFLFEEGEAGVSLDKERLQAELYQAVKDRRFDAAVEAVGLAEEQGAPQNGGSGQQSAEELKAQYQIIGTYTTKTTANSNRNTNILLASQALNGTVLKPGEVLSFNETVGQRTSKKGYKSAAAYSNGEVVQEIGGGVCQVSTTLYNAVVTSGLETVTRKSHTFKPTYVTPGMDATVSWGGPDYEFKNNSEHSVGVLAEFANQVLTISIYGIPVLEPGVTYSLESKKTADLGAPAPGYVEDRSLPPGSQVVKKNGSGGSKWATYLVITKDGQVISRELDHTASYKGHAGLVAVNSQAPAPTAAPAPEQTPPAAQTQPQTPAGPGVETQPQQPAGGPGMEQPADSPGSQPQQPEGGPSVESQPQQPAGPGAEPPPVQAQSGGPGSEMPPQTPEGPGL